MAKLKIKLASIYAPKPQKEPLLKRLQEMAVIDIETIALDQEAYALPDGYGRQETEKLCRAFERNIAAASNALKILDERASQKTGLLAFLEGPKALSRDEFYLNEDAFKQAERLVERIIQTDKFISEQKGEKVRLAALSEQLVPWLDLDVPLDLSKTAKTVCFSGTLVGYYDLDSLYERLAKLNPSLNIYAEIVHSSKDLTYVFIVCPYEQRNDTEKTLRELGFARPLQCSSKLPSEEYAFLQDELKKCDNELENALLKIREYAKDREKIEIFSDFCSFALENEKAKSEMAQTENTVMIKGYIAERDIDFLKKHLQSEFTVVIEIEEANEELAPVKLSNNAFYSPAETITQMYSLPSAKDIDPTPLTGFFYYLLFGMMLSDAGYGLLMLLGTGILLKKFKLSCSMRKTMKLFLYCSISTIFWGLVFGSFFGDSIAVISKTFIGKEIALPALIDPMNGGAVTLLVLSLGIGLAQIIAALGARFVTCIKNGDRAAAFFDAGLWITTLLGVGILAIGIFAVDILIKVGAVISIVSLIGLILTQGRAHKNIIVRLLVGVKSLYDITGYVSDLLSFSRLMALGLTTAAMGAVFNLLGTLGGKGIGGILLMLIIFPVGHAISFALNALGAYVHTLRLQYVELFSKFYDGGGREFKAFSLKNKYVDITNDIKEEI